MAPDRLEQGAEMIKRMATWLGDLRTGHSVWRRLPSTPQTTRPALLVTGGSEGLGLAFAEAFHDCADVIVLIARDDEKLKSARLRLLSVAEVQDGPIGDVLTLPLDLTEPGSGEALEIFLHEAGLHVEVLINNAGTGFAGAFADMPDETIAHLVDLNITVPTLLMRHVLPDMARRRSGGIVNVSSLAGYFPGPYQAQYYASKAYLTSLSEAVAFEAGRQGVRVLTVAPGPAETRIHHKMGGENAAYRFIMPSLSPAQVARSARFAYALGRTVVVPGFVNKAAAAVSGLIPHTLLVPLVALLLKPGERSGRSHVERD